MVLQRWFLLHTLSITSQNVHHFYTPCPNAHGRKVTRESECVCAFLRLLLTNVNIGIKMCKSRVRGSLTFHFLG